MRLLLTSYALVCLPTVIGSTAYDKTTYTTEGRAFETIVVKVVCVVGITELRDLE
jgi:hypothetical protein